MLIPVYLKTWIFKMQTHHLHPVATLPLFEKEMGRKTLDGGGLGVEQMVPQAINKVCLFGNMPMEISGISISSNNKMTSEQSDTHKMAIKKNLKLLPA